MEEQLIRYVHDGSEAPTDSFVLVANASEMDRQSQSMAFTITILPVNDQPPVLSTNTGLQVSSPLGPPHLRFWKETRVP